MTISNQALRPQGSTEKIKGRSPQLTRNRIFMLKMMFDVAWEMPKKMIFYGFFMALFMAFFTRNAERAFDFFALATIVAFAVFTFNILVHYTEVKKFFRVA